MASYIQGTQQYVPQVQPYQPDFNFMQTVATQKQTKYDAARKQLSNVYGSLLNSAMTRDDNIAARDEFFKQIDTDIKRMASIDLSKSENVASANEVFSQMLDDKAIVHDMTWTKNFNQQVQRSEMLKLDGKRENGDMWWEGGDRLLQYAREDFKNASADQAMNMGSVDYVAAKDIYGMAMKIAKDNDMEVKIDQSNGRYIYTMKNGQAAYKPFNEIFMGVLGQDPGVLQYYDAKAELAIKDFGYANKDQYGSTQAAEQAYIDQIGSQVEEQYRKLLGDSATNAKENKDKVELAKERLSEAISDDEENEMLKLIQEYEKQGDMLNATYDTVKKNDGALAQGGKYSRNTIKAMLSSLSLQGDLANVTMAVADMNQSMEMKADPYGLAAVQHEYAKEMALINYQYDIMKLDAEGKLKGSSGKGGSGGDNPITYSDYQGAVTGGSSEEAQFGAYNMRASELNEMLEETVGDERTFSNAYLQALGNEAESGQNSTLAKEYYADLIHSAMSSQGSYSYGGDADENYIAAKKAFDAEYAKASTTEQKYAVAKKYAGAFANNAESYLNMSNYVMNNFSSNNKKNKLFDTSNSVFKTLWENENMCQLRNNMTAKRAMLNQYKSSLGRDVESICQGLYADESMGDQRERENLQDCIRAYAKSNGDFATEDEYTNALLQSGFAQRNGATEEEVREFAHLSYSGYENDYTFPIGSHKENVVDRFISNDPWEVDEGNLFFDRDKLFGVKDAFKTLYGRYSKINGDLEGQGMTWSRAIGFNVSGDEKNGFNQYNGDFQQYLMQAMNNIGGFAHVYRGALSAEPDSKDELSDDDARYLLSQYINDSRNKESGNVFQVRYVNTAQGKADMVALEVTCPFDWGKQFTDKKYGAGSISPTMTIYMDKNAYNGAFKNMGKSNSLDYLMKVQGCVKLDEGTDFGRNLLIKRHPSGGYYITGSIYNGKQYVPFDSYSTLQRPIYSSPLEAYNDWRQAVPALRQQIALSKNS